MRQSISELSDLAESIGINNLSKGKVAVINIAKKKNIEIIYGKYGHYFEGLLCFEDGKFYMHINLEKVTDIKSGRIRFTISHELGHFFIDHHRQKLKQGISLSFHGELTPEQKHIEKEANQFASSLLMPKSLFCNYAKKTEPGLESILSLKKRFDVSIGATAIQYLKFNLSCSIMINWHPDFSFHYASYSEQFSSLTGISGKTPIGFPTDYVKEITKIVDVNSKDYFETATPLSRWISTISPGSSKDLIGLEQTIKLGDFGGIALLTFYR